VFHDLQADADDAGTAVPTGIKTEAISYKDMFLVSDSTVTTTPTTAEDKSKLANYGWYMNLPRDYHVNVEPGYDGETVLFAANKYVLNDQGYMDDPDTQCQKSIFTGELFGRDVATGDSILMDGSTQKAFYDETQGVVGFSVILLPPSSGANPVRHHGIAVFTPRGQMLQEDTQTLGGGGSNMTGVPVRTNIRYTF
jgi:hypothetical protein